MTKSASSSSALPTEKSVFASRALLPTFYAHSGFCGKEPTEAQRRFITTKEDFVNMLGSLQKKYKDTPNVTIGMVFHSLRAVTPDEMRYILASDEVHGKNFPIHIHIAEQQKEVDDCVASTGKRPVEWLLDEVFDKGLTDLKRWTLVHETHLTADEAKRLAESGSVAGFCPITESDLGDGVPLAKEYITYGGKWGVGSDSNGIMGALAELLTFEHDQRKKFQERNSLAIHEISTGKKLYCGAVEGGSKSLGQKTGLLKVGCRADFIILDANHTILRDKTGDKILDSAVMAANTRTPIRHVMTAGEWQVRDRKHMQTPLVDEDRKVVLELQVAELQAQVDKLNGIIQKVFGRQSRCIVGVVYGPSAAHQAELYTVRITKRRHQLSQSTNDILGLFDAHKGKFPRNVPYHQLPSNPTVEVQVGY